MRRRPPRSPRTATLCPYTPLFRSVRRPLRVAVFSTGDEVREPGSDRGDGGIYDSNRYTLKALLRGLGCAVTDLGILADDRDAIRAARSEEHTSELQSLMSRSYAVFCLKNKKLNCRKHQLPAT